MTAAIKRTMDVSLALSLAALMAPVLLLGVLVVRGTSAGPALFRQVRVGRDGRPFVMLKLRTMYVGSADAVHRDYVRAMLAGAAVLTDGLYKLKDDPRVTPVGAFLRRWSLDELPQLWNVVRGDMSLVGPRPALPWETESFPDWTRDRISVRPGLTGLWQVSGRNKLTMLDGLRLDSWYVSHASIVLDVRILLRTLAVVLGRETR
jgi:lipopolysaccharide/colanic/teichoic acid biosynthesis glycosyltransferase